MLVRPAAVVSVAQALAGHAEVSFCAVTTGPSNLGPRSSAAMETAPLIRTVKRNGALLPA